MRLAASDGKTIINSKIVPTPKSFEQGIETFKQIAQTLCGGEKIDVIVGGIAGVLDKDKTVLVKSPHVTGWTGKPLKPELSKIFEAEVRLENDTALEGLGEAWMGGNNKGIVGYINIGTGIGGVRIVEGEIDKNSLGFEPGHHIIVPDGNPCSCGGKGHWEAYVAGSYLEGLYQQRGEDIKDPQIWDEIAKYIGIGLTNVTVCWSPDIIIMGGSISRSIPITKVQAYLDQFLTIFPKSPPVKLATLGDEVGLYGALQLLK